MPFSYFLSHSKSPQSVKDNVHLPGYSPRTLSPGPGPGADLFTSEHAYKSTPTLLPLSAGRYHVLSSPLLGWFLPWPTHTSSFSSHLEKVYPSFSFSVCLSLWKSSLILRSGSGPSHAILPCSALSPSESYYSVLHLCPPLGCKPREDRVCISFACCSLVYMPSS